MVTLKDLFPLKKHLVIDVVAAAGIDTATWKTKTDPSKRSNWSFGGNKEPTLLFVWHNHIRINEKGWIYYLDKSKEWAIAKERESGRGSKLQAFRAHDFHSRLNQAYFANLPVRVAILDGKRNDNGVDQADARELDNEYWYTHHFNEKTSEILLVRGVPRPEKSDQPEVGNLISMQSEIAEPPVAPISPGLAPGLVEPEALIGMPESPDPSRHYTRGTMAYDRDSEVGWQAKTRASGHCECCGDQGFETVRGGSYLEAHHVIPLSCGGVDEVWNVVAICPNDHKRAHFGKDRIQLRDNLITWLASRYQSRKSHLLAMVAKMDANLAKDSLLEEDLYGE